MRTWRPTLHVRARRGSCSSVDCRPRGAREEGHRLRWNCMIQFVSRSARILRGRLLPPSGGRRDVPRCSESGSSSRPRHRRRRRSRSHSRSGRRPAVRPDRAESARQATRIAHCPVFGSNERSATPRLGPAVVWNTLSSTFASPPMIWWSLLVPSNSTHSCPPSGSFFSVRWCTRPGPDLEIEVAGPGRPLAFCA